MKKATRFLSGAVCGAVIGAAASLLFTPTSGQDLRAKARARWEDAIAEAQSEMERTQQELAQQLERKNN